MSFSLAGNCQGCAPLLQSSRGCVPLQQSSRGCVPLALQQSSRGCVHHCNTFSEAVHQCKVPGAAHYCNNISGAVHHCTNLSGAVHHCTNLSGAVHHHSKVSGAVHVQHGRMKRIKIFAARENYILRKIFLLLYEAFSALVLVLPQLSGVEQSLAEAPIPLYIFYLYPNQSCIKNSSAARTKLPDRNQAHPNDRRERERSFVSSACEWSCDRPLSKKQWNVNYFHWSYNYRQQITP